MVEGVVTSKTPDQVMEKADEGVAVCAIDIMNIDTPPTLTLAHPTLTQPWKRLYAAVDLKLLLFWRFIL